MTATTPMTWNATDAARSSVTDHRDAVAWLRNSLAAALRSYVESDRAAEWQPETTSGTPRFAAWLEHAYGITPELPVGELAAAAEMPMTSQWLTDRADRLEGAEQLVASPAAVAVAAAAAQALTAADLDTLTAQVNSLPFRTAHLTLSAPVDVEDRAGDALDTVQALTWWDDTDSVAVRVMTWVDTMSTVDENDARRIVAASRQYGATLPALMFDAEHCHRSTLEGPVAVDPIPTEGQFSFGAPVHDLDEGFAARMALVVRHLIAAGVLVGTAERVRPQGSSGHVARVPVVALRVASGDDAITHRLISPGTAVAIRRTRTEQRLVWSALVVDGDQWTWSAPTACSREWAVASTKRYRTCRP
ncbi:hypothetical protein [Prescottella equi]